MSLLSFGLTNIFLQGIQLLVVLMVLKHLMNVLLLPEQVAPQNKANQIFEYFLALSEVLGTFFVYSDTFGGSFRN